jgi:hypothetical protein
MLVVTLSLAVPTSATPHMKGAAREAEGLQRQAVRLFDRLDHVGGVIERVRTDIARADARISVLSRRIEAQQLLLNRRAAEAYMAGRAGGIESVLDSSSFTDLEDALEFIDAISQEDEDLLLALKRSKAEIEIERARLDALAEELMRRRERLQATASDLVETLRLQQALPRSTDEETPSDTDVADATAPTFPPSPASSDPVPGRESVTLLIRERFAPLGARTTRVALCVAGAESGFDPAAVNPATGAAGVFQFLPSTWDSLSGLAGWATASVFDARANVAVAAWTVARYGWHPWRSVAAGCGV